MKQLINLNKLFVQVVLYFIGSFVLISIFFYKESSCIFPSLKRQVKSCSLAKDAYSGNLYIQKELAQKYYKKNQYKKSLFWYKKMIKNETFNSYNEIINMYLEIKDRSKIFKKNNIYKLIEEYQKWAKAGDVEAQKHLITLSCYNLFPKNNYIKTLYKKWENIPHMMFNCILYKNNLEIGRDNEKIINLFDELALEKNNIGFKYEIWLRRLYSEGQQKKYNKSIFEKAILNEYSPALWFYGLLLITYDINSSINFFKQYYKLTIFLKEKDKKQKAIEVFEKLHRKKKWNSISAWLTVGKNFAYQYQTKSSKLEKNNFKEAIRWYKKAYSLGEPKAAYKIGMLYKEGDKTLKQNYSKAFEWLYKSAVQNYMPAQIKLGEIYLNGLGVEKNQIEAIKWYKKTSEHSSFFCKQCYTTDLILNKLGFVKFIKNIKLIYEF